MAFNHDDNYDIILPPSLSKIILLNSCMPSCYVANENQAYTTRKDPRYEQRSSS
jgi:hypothetical protein